jgi:hypothetical protein
MTNIYGPSHGIGWVIILKHLLLLRKHWQGIIAYDYLRLIKDLGIPFEE